jgi:hypothetical protein
MIGKIGYFIEVEENDDMWVALSFCFLDLLIFFIFPWISLFFINLFVLMGNQGNLLVGFGL